MKKVFRAIFTLAIVLFSSLVFSSCGNDYKNMALEVYTFSDGTWVKVDTDNGLDFNIPDDEDSVKFYKENGYYQLFLRVNVVGTKKNVDSIFVSNTNTTSFTFSKNEIAPEATLTCRVYSTGSGVITFDPSDDGGYDKSVSFKINIYEKLTEIAQNPNYIPGLSVGGSLALEDIPQIISYNPNGKETNQTGVNYELVGVGSYTYSGGENPTKEFTQKLGAEKLDDGFAVVDNGKQIVKLTTTYKNTITLSSDYALDNQNYIIRLKATSIYKEEITSFVDVYVVDKIQSTSFISYAKFDKDGFLSKEEDNYDKEKDAITSLDLYPSSPLYNETNIAFIKNNTLNVYNYATTPNLKINVYVDGVLYDVERSTDYYNGVRLSYQYDKEGNIIPYMFKVQTNSSFTTSTRTNIKFVATINGIVYENSLLTSNLVVNRKPLANAITLNNTVYTENTSKEATGVIYTYYAPESKGYEIKLKGNMSDGSYTDVEWESFLSNDKPLTTSYYTLKNYKGVNPQVVGTADNNNVYKIFANIDTFYMTLNQNYSTNNLESNKGYINIKIRLKTTPDKFEGVQFSSKNENEKYQPKYLEIVLKLSVYAGMEDAYISDSNSNKTDKFVNAYYESKHVYDGYVVSHTSTNLSVDASSIKISSANGNIEFSSNKEDYFDTINYSQLINGHLYFRSKNIGEDRILIICDNGKTVEKSFNFVNTMSEAEIEKIALNYDTTNLGFYEKGTETTKENEDIKTFDVYYFALQNGTNFDLKVNYGGKDNSKITKLEIEKLNNYNSTNILNYSTSAVEITQFKDSFGFNVKAGIIDFTARISVKIKYFTTISSLVQEGEKELFVEVAIYKPIGYINTRLSKNEIMYINAFYPDQSKASVNLSYNETASKNITFSSGDINKKIKYEDCIYSIKTDIEYKYKVSNNNIDTADYFDISGITKYYFKDYFIDLSKNLLTLECKENVEKYFGSVEIKFTVCEFGKETSLATKVVINILWKTEVENVLLEGLNYNNIFLSLWDDKDRIKKFTAYVSNNEATIKDLGYVVYAYDGSKQGFKGNKLENQNYLSIIYDKDKSEFTITAQGDVGGKYVLEIVALDSYNGKTYNKTSDPIIVNVSDGSVDNPYYLTSSSQMKYLKNNTDKHYILANDISLKDSGQLAEGFTGSIDGAMTIEYADNGKTNLLTKKYAFTDFTLNDKCFTKTASNGYTGSLYGMFGWLGVNARLENITLYASINISSLTDVVATAQASCVGLFAGINKGKIINCSIILDNSSIKKQNSIENGFNFGVFVGNNEGTIISNQTNDFVNCESTLTITINRMRKNSGTTYDISNIGGIAGVNSGEIKGDFVYTTTNSLENLITNNINIVVKHKELTEEERANDSTKNSYNTIHAYVGGVVGENIGKISNIACSGVITVEGNMSVGGIAGWNAGTLMHSANFAMQLQGSEGTKGDNTTVNTEDIKQNVGGVVGLLKSATSNEQSTTAIVEDVRVIAITLNEKESIIQGIDFVAGVVAESENGSITYAFVESFDNNFFITGGNVAGVANGSAKIDKSFANVNLASTKIVNSGDNNTKFVLPIGEKYQYSYFIGSIKSTNTEITNARLEINVKTDNKVNKDGDDYYVGNSYSVITLLPDADNSIEIKNKLSIQQDTKIWYEEGDNNGLSIKDAIWYQSNNYNDRYPIIMYGNGYDNGLGGNYNGNRLTITIKPTEINFDPNKDYIDGEDVEVIINKKGIYYSYTENGETKVKIAVYLNNEGNSHLLVSKNENKGLINETVLPSLANGLYSAKIVEGSRYAYLSGDNIVFTRAGKVVVQFTSLYNNTLTDKVEIYALDGLTDAYTINAFNEKVENISSYVDNTISLDTKLVNTNADGVINSSYLYMTISGFNTNLIDITGNGYLGEYQYQVGQFGITTKNWSTAENTQSTTLTIKIYLGTFDGKEWLNGGIELASWKVPVKVFKTATNLEILSASNQLIESGSDVVLNAKLYTSFVGNTETEIENITYLSGQEIVLGSNNRLLLNLQDKDSIYLRMSCDSEIIKSLINSEGLSNYFELFDVSVGYKHSKNSSKIDGFIYVIELTLKSEYRKYITNYCKFDVEFFANSNPAVKNISSFTIIPQSLNSLRMEHFANGTATIVGDSTTVEYTSSESPSSKIIPGKSGLMKIYCEPNFANVDEVYVKSSVVSIDSVDYKVRFQQMVYNKDGYYQSISGNYGTEDNFGLLPVSYIENGKYTFNGVYFVRTILSNIVGMNKTFTITTTAVSYEKDNLGEFVLENGEKKVSSTKTKEKMLLTSFVPGVYASVGETSTARIDDTKYLIEKNGTFEVAVKVVGYQFNTTPRLTIKFANGGGDVRGYLSTMQSEVKDLGNNEFEILFTFAQIQEITKAFTITFNIELISDGTIISNEGKEIKYTFYPVDYILKGAKVKNSANDSLEVAVNSSTNLEFLWITANNSTSKSSLVNDSLPNITDYLYINDKKITHYDFKEYFTISNGVITGVGKSSHLVNLRLYYKYEYDNNNNYQILFNNNGENGYELFEYSFRLNVVVRTTEKSPTAIYNQADFEVMSEDGNYILMNDITLNGWVPKEANFASLDGNNKLIKIVSFDIESNENLIVGLFSTISENTTIKNLTIDLAELENNILLEDINKEIATVNFGFLAGVNNGIVYNCEVLSTNTKEFTIITNTEENNYSLLTYGGLVGVNNGNIVNSRFGTEYFGRVNPQNSILTKISCGIIKISANGIMAGLVGENTSTGVIASSYFANATLINTCTVPSDDKNMLAGFVAINRGVISSSYSKGRESTISLTNLRASGTKLESKGASSTAGFVFVNSGEINNSYSNIECISNSYAVAGFVFNNTSSGKIKQCYSASKVISNSTDYALATELPFVGCDASNVALSNGEMQDCYYLIITGDNFDESAVSYPTNEKAYALNYENMGKAESFNNFAFINGNYEQSLQGVWTYYTNIDTNKKIASLGSTNLPELTSANQIARSVRVISSSSGELQEYSYINNYALGSQNNPYIIRTANEYNNILTTTDNTSDKSFAGYVRFVDNIDFEQNGIKQSIITSTNFVLGDKTNTSLTVVDGNGMKLENVTINMTTANNLTFMGLFAEVEYSVIKNLTVDYSNMPYTSTTTSYVGGLAGRLNNSYVINLSLNGNDAVITAYNFAGGLAGVIEGESGVFNVESSLDAVACFEGDVNTFSQYQNENDYQNTFGSGYEYYRSRLSYAGGLAGVLDIRNNNNINISTITINGVNVEADVAGGVVGYVGGKVNASRLKYIVNDNSSISGDIIAGGLVGESYGKIKLSQISYETDTQYEHDKAMATYIMSKQQDNFMYSMSSLTNFGNLNLIKGSNIVGGMIGVMYSGKVENSYAKTSISSNGNYIGGLIGVAFNTELEYVYNQTFFDFENTIKSCYIGGTIGAVVSENDNELLQLKSLRNKQGTDALSKDLNNYEIKNLVSIITFDKAKLLDLENNINYSLGYKTSVTTITPQKMYSSSFKNLFENNISNETTKNNSTNKFTNNIGGIFNFEDLFDVSSPNQKVCFETLFGNWLEEYWTKDNLKYTPELKSGYVMNYYTIKTEEDLNLLSLHPDSNFIVANDITLQNTYINYVVNAEFKGTLIGAMVQDGENVRPARIIGIKITTNDTTTTAGFFRKTKNADVSNLGFAFNNIDISVDKGNVGLLSAEDVEGKFKNITITNNNGNGQKVITQNSGKVGHFGGMIGSAVRTSIVSCDVINISINKLNVYNTFGGIIGYADGTRQDETSIELYNVLIQSSSASFDGTINNENNVEGNGTPINVGGIIGKSQYSTVASCEFKNSVNNKETPSITISGVVNVGGIIGYQINSTIKDSNADIEFGLSFSNINSEGSSTLRVGGVAGYVENGTTNADIENTYANIHTLLIGDQNNSNESEINMVLGGIVGDGVNAVINYATSKVDVDFVETEDGEEKDIYDVNAKPMDINSLFMGGIIGYVRGDYTSKLSHTFAYIDNAQAYTKSVAKLGGLIGFAHGNVTVDTSASVGRIRAYNKQDDGNDSITLGGMLGELDSVSATITNSYTTCVLDTVNIYANNGKTKTADIFTNAIVGNILGGSLSVGAVFYSSDYVLALEHNNYTKISGYTYGVQNLDATLITSTLITQETNIVDNYGSSEKYYLYLNQEYAQQNTGLPYIEATKEHLYNLGILNNEETGKDSVLYPIIINSSSKIDDYTNYTYARLIEMNDSLLGKEIKNLHIMGSGTTIKLTNTFVKSLDKNSVIANVNFIADEDVSNIIADENSGVIFMCSTDSSKILKSTNFASFVNNNNGKILYSYSVVDVESDGALTASGLVNTNGNGDNGYSNAYIANSYFTGTLYGSGDARNGFVDTNNGTIINSYSAGSIFATQTKKDDSAIQFVSSNNGYGENNYYDIFASGLTSKVDFVKACKTQDLINGITKIKGYASYMLGNTENELNKSFNFGYPIIEFNQLHYTDTGSGVLGARIRGINLNKVKDIYGSLDDEDALLKRFGLYMANTNEINILWGLYTGNGEENTPYMIPTLGILSMVKDSTITKEGEDTKPIYFKQIYNIKTGGTTDSKKGTIQDVTWQGLSEFAGVYYSGSRYENVNDDGQDTVDDNTSGGESSSGTEEGGSSKTKFKTIFGLCGSGLFNSLYDGAIVKDLIFQDITITSGNCGVLAESVGKNTDDEQINSTVRVSNITLQGNITGKSLYSGLVGRVCEGSVLYLDTIIFDENAIVGACDDESKNIDIQSTNLSGGLIGLVEGKANVSNISYNSSVVFNVNSGTFGLIAGKISATGIANVKSFAGNNVEICLWSNSSSGVGILIGEIQGKLNITSDSKIGSTGENSSPVKVTRHDNGNADVKVGSVGSIAGKLSQEEGKDTPEIKIIKYNGDFTLNVSLTGSNTIGGLFGEMSCGGFYGYCDVAKDKDGTLDDEKPGDDKINNMENYIPVSVENESYTIININGVDANGGTAGGLVGTMSGGEILGVNVKFDGKTGSENNIYDSSSFGGLVGKMTGGSIGVSTKYRENDEFVSSSILLEMSNQVQIKNANFGGLVGTMTDLQDKDKQSIDGGIKLSNIKLTKLEATGYGCTSMGGLVGVYATNYPAYIDCDISNITLTGDMNSANIGGMVGLMTTNAIEISENVKLAGDVKGYTNVGGLVGHYSCDKILTFINYDNIMSNSSIRVSFEIITDNASSGNNEGSGSSQTTTDGLKNASNLGGLFGLYESSNTTFAYSLQINGQDAPKAYQNKNAVSFSSVSNDMYKGETGAYLIQNVGGVAGKFVYNSNESNTVISINASNSAEIGESSLTDDNFSSEEANKLNVQNVGGIFGYTDAKIDLCNVSNSGAIKGYINVGGILGEAEIKGINVSNPAENSGEINGYKNIGGIVGYMHGTLDSLSDLSGIKSSGAITGVANVGGMFGYIDMTSSMYANLSIPKVELSSVKIVGNSNVGGVIGSINLSGNIKVSVGSANGDASKIELELQGLIYTYTSKDQANQNNDEEKKFVPTSIGGVIGYARKNNEAKLELVNLEVSGKIYDYDSSNKNDALSADSEQNFVAESYNPDYKSYKDQHYAIDFASGIGGFIGTSIGNFVSGTSYVNVNILTYAGINVGECFGYINTEDAIALPKIDNTQADIRVFGRAFVGGMIGRAISDQPINIDMTNVFGSNSGSNDETTEEKETYYLILQEEEYNKTQDGETQQNENTASKNPEDYAVVGDYIGALIGHSSSIGSAKITENDKIIINNYSALYCGGIVGCLEGDLGKNGENDVAIDKIKALETIKTPKENGAQGETENKPNDNVLFKFMDKYNYGGLAGFVEVKGNYTIQGSHYFDFTVDTLENANIVCSDYFYEYTENTDSSIISSITHYSSNSNVSISASKKEISTNPIIAKTDSKAETGWAKDYTMFRSMKTLMQDGQDNKKRISQVVFDAQRIVGVNKTSYETFTGENKGINLPKDSKGNLEFTETKFEQTVPEILYTLYESNGSVLMYTAVGIFTLDMNNTVDTVSQDTDKKVQYVRCQDYSKNPLYMTTNNAYPLYRSAENKGSGGYYNYYGYSNYYSLYRSQYCRAKVKNLTTYYYGTTGITLPTKYDAYKSGDNYNFLLSRLYGNFETGLKEESVNGEITFPNENLLVNANFANSGSVLDINAYVNNHIDNIEVEFTLPWWAKLLVFIVRAYSFNIAFVGTGGGVYWGLKLSESLGNVVKDALYQVIHANFLNSIQETVIFTDYEGQQGLISKGVNLLWHFNENILVNDVEDRVLFNVPITNEENETSEPIKGNVYYVYYGTEIPEDFYDVYTFISTKESSTTTTINGDQVYVPKNGDKMPLYVRDGNGFIYMNAFSGLSNNYDVQQNSEAIKNNDNYKDLINKGIIKEINGQYYIYHNEDGSRIDNKDDIKDSYEIYLDAVENDTLNNYKTSLKQTVNNSYTYLETTGTPEGTEGFDYVKMSKKDYIENQKYTSLEASKDEYQRYLEIYGKLAIYDADKETIYYPNSSGSISATSVPGLENQIPNTLYFKLDNSSSNAILSRSHSYYLISTLPDKYKEDKAGNLYKYYTTANSFTVIAYDENGNPTTDVDLFVEDNLGKYFLDPEHTIPLSSVYIIDGNKIYYRDVDMMQTKGAYYSTYSTNTTLNAKDDFDNKFTYIINGITFHTRYKLDANKFYKYISELKDADGNKIDLWPKSNGSDQRPGGGGTYFAEINMLSINSYNSDGKLVSGIKVLK